MKTRPLDLLEEHQEEHDELPPAPTGAHLSWRDVYAAVAYSERRVLGAIERLRVDLSKASDDHEVRMRTLEGLVVTKAEFDALVLRVGKNEDCLQGFRDRETGITSTLKGQRDLIMLFIAIVTVAAVFILRV